LPKAHAPTRTGELKNAQKKNDTARPNRDNKYLYSSDLMETEPETELGD
jgi:hypothetical protein